MVPKILVVGDSTVSAFNDITYYFPRFGYGVLLNKYFRGINIINLSLSGRSSRSYVNEKNYPIYLNSIEKGDFVIIGFGHNDEKSDDIVRYTDARVPKEDPTGFKYSLYERFIKPAKEKGATCIICTPIPRLDLTMSYEGNVVHNTKTGDYRKAALELADELGLLGIDLTFPMRDYSIELGENQIYLHAFSKGKKENGVLVPDPKSVDKAHLSYFGANSVAYFLAKQIERVNHPLALYLVDEIKKPSLADLKRNPSYVFKDYFTPDLEHYQAPSCFSCKAPYYGTAFGILDTTDPVYMAFEKDDKFIVGCENKYGKFNASNDGFAFAFRRVDKTKNFKFTAHAKVKSTIETRQAGFGIMLRSDAYINQTVKNESYSTNYIASGLVTTDKMTYVNFSRSNPTDLKKELNTFDDFYHQGEEMDFSIERLGQVVTVITKFRGQEFKTVFTDFDYLSMDHDYVYLGMFANGGTVAEFSDVSFELKGNAKEA